MLTFIESGTFIYVLAALAAVGIVAKFAAALRYSKLERQAEDVPAAKDTYIKLWKNRFENTYKINKGMCESDIFVERCLNQCKLLKLSLNGLDRLNRVLCSLCLILGAVAATMEVRAGFLTGLILNHFLTSVCICAVMVFVEFACDTGEKRQRIALNLEDYFVNSLSPRLQLSAEMVTAEPDHVVRLNLREPVGEAKTESREGFRGEGFRRGEFRRDTLIGRDEGRREGFHKDESRRELLYRGETAQSEEQKETVGRETAHREATAESLKESLERIAASREPEDDERREKRSRRREEDVRLIEEILREYLR